MPEPQDACRPVALPSGETLRVRSSGEMFPEAVAALGTLVDAARRLAAAENPPEPGTAALWARVGAVKAGRGLTLREAAGECGVRFSVLFRIGQGRMPDTNALATIETWLADTIQPVNEE